MAFCTNCGTKFEEGAKFCTNCGAKNESVEHAASVSEPPAGELADREYAEQVGPETGDNAAAEEYIGPKESTAAGECTAPQANEGSYYSVQPSLSEEEKIAARKKKNRTIVIAICAVLIIAAVFVIIISSRIAKMITELMNYDYNYSYEEPTSSAPESPVPDPPAEKLLEKNTYWYGFAEISNHSGTENHSEGVYEVWAILGEDENGKTFFEVYDNYEMENGPILSYWVDIYSDFVEADIGEEDAWLLDIYLFEEEEFYFSFWLENGAVSFSYPYEFEGESFDISFFLREEGAEWDAENDPYIP